MWLSACKIAGGRKKRHERNATGAKALLNLIALIPPTEVGGFHLL